MCQERKPHKHAAFIKAWADNPKIEFQVRVPRAGRLDTQWEDVGGDPVWVESLEYRIKPKEPIVRYFNLSHSTGSKFWTLTSNVAAKFDSETGELLYISKI